MLNKLELLAPAGNLEKLEIAYIYGADAVYIGGKEFGLRAKAGNFSIDEIKQAKEISLKWNKKLYVAVNIFLKDSLVSKIIEYLKALNEIKVDAVIISDPGIIYLCQKYAEDLPIHLSTQANTLNWPACEFWRGQGLERVVLGRETTLDNCRSIHQGTKIELEAFVHGAMCMAYSGRCMLSMYMTGKSANEGSCTHPCRWEYYVVEKQREGEYMKIEEDDQGTYIFNSKDLCMLPYLKELKDAGITSFKVEGRMKSIHYIATVVKAYREAIDLLLENKKMDGVIPRLMEELTGIGERDYSTGFYLGQIDETIQQYDPCNVLKPIRFAGKILEDPKDGLVKIEQRNKFSVGDELEVLTVKGENKKVLITKIINMSGVEVSSAPHPKEEIYINSIDGMQKNALLRLRS